MKKLLGINLTDDEFDYLMCEQSNGKELKVIDGKIVAEYHQLTDEEQNQYKIVEYKTWFKDYFEYQLTQSLWQSDFTPSHDEYFDKDYADIDELKQQAEFVRAEIKRLK